MQANRSNVAFYSSQRWDQVVGLLGRARLVLSPMTFSLCRDRFLLSEARGEEVLAGGENDHLADRKKGVSSDAKDFIYSVYLRFV